MSKMKQAKHSTKRGKHKHKDMPKISQHCAGVKTCKSHSEVLRHSKAEREDFSLDMEESSEESSESNVESDLPDANMEESELERIWAEGKWGKKKLFSQATKVKADGPAQRISSPKKLSRSQHDWSPSPKRTSGQRSRKESARDHPKSRNSSQGPLKGKREGCSEKLSAKHVRSQSLSTHSRVSSARSSSRASTACSSSCTPSTLDDCDDDDNDNDNDNDNEDKEEVKGRRRDSDSDDSDVRGESDDQDSDSRGESDEDSNGPQKCKTKKAKSGDYKGIEREILDRMVLSLQLFLVTEDYFPSPQQLVEVSTMKWEDAVS